MLEDVTARAGLAPETAFDTTWAYEFADEETLRRAMAAPAGVAVLVGPAREDEFKDGVVEALAGRRTADGGYRLQNAHHYLIARA